MKIKRQFALLSLGLFFALAANAGETATDVPSFRQNIMPVFFRAGCNVGSCHGAARGKDGFMLSLFGYDPAGDYFRIVNDVAGRRVNTAVPEQSLLLRKAIGAVPHTGGEVFDKNSEYYQTILRWIAAGAPDDAANVPSTVGLELVKDSFVLDSETGKDALRVIALTSDGAKNDVTTLARYHSNNVSVTTIDENGRISAVHAGDTDVFARYSRFAVGAKVTVLQRNDNFKWPNPKAFNYIDENVFERLEKLRIAPSELCDDETFLRRVTLDLSGLPPTPDEFRAFMADTRPDKRTLKIDELLANDNFADLWTTLWGEQLRVMGGNYAPDATHIKAADAFYEWIRRQMRSKRPLNEFVAEMVTASGSNLTNGPANLYTMLVHSPRLTPKAFASDFSQVFLGVQLQCAECHNHPFDRWNMDDYYGFVSFFTGVKRKPGIEPRETRIFFDPTVPPATHLRDDRPVPAKILGAIEPVKAGGDPRRALAAWLTAPENELFSRNLANRIWAQLMGRGIVHPVDDVRVTNPASNEPLLDALSKHLVASRFDLHTLVRDICTSRTYQLSSRPNETNARDTRQFSHAYLRRLRADVLSDTIVAVTGVKKNFSGFPEGTRAIDYYPRTSGDTEGPHFGEDFFKTFGRSSRGTICSCETKSAPTISQTLNLSVGDTITPRLTAGGKLKALIDSKPSSEAVLEELYIWTLCRRPNEKEAKELCALVGPDFKKPQAYEDIFWALLNSTEFLFNH
jgi:hypothetical protein